MTLALVVACGKPEVGSEEELRGQIEAIGLPAGMVELDHAYLEDCRITCPSLVVWYEVIGPVEATRDQLIGALTEGGWEVKDSAAGYGVYSARKEGHMAFVVVNQEMIEKNAQAPLGTKVELSVHRVPDEIGDLTPGAFEGRAPAESREFTRRLR